MRHLWIAVVAVAVTAGPGAAGETQFKPIDTNALVVQPSQTAAKLTAATIGIVGNTAARALAEDGYVKTINNLFGFRRETPSPTQPGRSPIPAPGLYQSTQYKNYNTPVMPSSQPVRGK